MTVRGDWCRPRKFPFGNNGNLILSQLTLETVDAGKGFREDMLLLPEWSTSRKNLGFDVSAQDESRNTALIPLVIAIRRFTNGGGFRVGSKCKGRPCSQDLRIDQIRRRYLLP